jgi:RHS repeat-associated protein
MAKGSWSRSSTPAVNAGATPSGLLETPSTPTSFIEMFGYTQPGSVAGKRLRVTKTFEYPAGSGQHVSVSGDLDSTYTYDTEGKVTTVGYPAVIGGPGPSYAYSFDTLGRPIGLTDNANSAVVSNVQYGPASELLQMTMTGIGTETRQYNNRLQLVHLSIPGQDLAYAFDTSGHNDGKILNQRDAISGEQVSYLYDSLSRLSSATGSGWSQSYQYDGFGNLLARNATGTAPGSTFAVDPATNRLGGYAYDNNGNLLSVGYQYDAENRLVQANSGGAQYFYDSQNKRIWQGNYAWDDTSGIWNFVSEVFNVYGANGQMLGSYQPQIGYLGSRPNSLTFYQSSARVYFGRKLIAAQDRLGSVGKYHPYGEERNSPPLANDQVKFATYTRDSATGLDYADQRYYASTFGRFMTPDPYHGSAGATKPESWNRYAYTVGDPVNYKDPQGLFLVAPETYPGACDYTSLDGQCDEEGEGGGGCFVDEFSPNPNPANCSFNPDPPPPPPPAPDCTIELFSRPTPSSGPVVKGKGNHTYLYIVGTDYPTGLMIEAGPVKGKLTGMINPPGAGLAAGKWNASNPTNPTTNQEIGDPYDDPGCQDVIKLLNAVNKYNSGSKVAYTFLSGFSYNSNAFTYTLLSDIGLSNAFGHPTGRTPGWGQLVPSLTVP